MLNVVYFYHEDTGTSRARYGGLFLPASVNALKKYLQCDYRITVFLSGNLPAGIDAKNITVIKDKGYGSVAAQAEAFLTLEYEHWLHLDDDVLLTKPVGMDAFIQNGKPLIRCRQTPYHYADNESNSWKRSIVSTSKLINEVCARNYLTHQTRHAYHSPHFYTRQLCRIMRVLIGNELKRTAETKGRQASNICDIALPALFEAALKYNVTLSHESLFDYVKTDSTKTADELRAMKKPFLVINDAPTVSKGIREFLSDFTES